MCMALCACVLIGPRIAARFGTGSPRRGAGLPPHERPSAQWRRAGVRCPWHLPAPPRPQRHARPRVGSAASSQPALRAPPPSLEGGGSARAPPRANFGRRAHPWCAWLVAGAWGARAPELPQPTQRVHTSVQTRVLSRSARSLAHAALEGVVAMAGAHSARATRRRGPVAAQRGAADGVRNVGPCPTAAASARARVP